MQIKKTSNIVKRLYEVTLVERLEQCSETELLVQIQGISRDWPRPRGDLCAWIPVLNRFDDILTRMVNKYGLDCSTVAEPKTMEHDDEEILICVLEFTAFLLEKCSNRGIYASVKQLACLLKSNCPKVVEASLRVCVEIAQRFAQSRMGRSNVTAVDPEIIFRLVKVVPEKDKANITGNGQRKSISSSAALLSGPTATNTAPESSSSIAATSEPITAAADRLTAATTTDDTADGATGEQTTPSELRDFINLPELYPASLTVHYYQTKKSHNGMATITFTKDQLISTGLASLEQQVFTTVPNDFFFETLYRLWAARAVALSFDKDEKKRREGKETRQTLVRIQLLAMGFAACSLSEDTVEGRILERNPNLIKQIGGLIFPSVNMDNKVRVLALDTLSYICHQNSRRAEVLAAVSGNVSHGALMTCLRNMVTALHKGEEVDEELSSSVFATIIHVAASQSLCMILVSAGLIPLLLELIQTPNNTKCVRTLSAAMELLDHVIIDVPATFGVFTQARGVPILIDIITKEVEYDLEQGPTEPPDLCTVDYSMGYFRSQWIRSLFVVVSNILMHIRTSENIHSLVDSPLLQVSKQVITNSALFGSRVVSLCMQIISAMLENEPTSAFGIMQEAKVIDVVLDALPVLLDQSQTYYSAVAKLIGAMAHSEGGLKLIKERKLMPWFVRSVSNCDWAAADGVAYLGTVFESLTTDHQELRPLLITEILNMIKKAPETFAQLYGDGFYVESELPNANLELIGEYEDMPKRATGLAHMIRFVEALLKNHLTQAEFIRQSGVDVLLGLCETEGIPYDFGAGSTGEALGRVLRFLFSLDIERESIQNALISHIIKWIDSVEGFIEDAGVTEVIRTDKADQFLRTMAKLQAVVFAFFQTVLHDYGTGYRVMAVVDKMVRMSEQHQQSGDDEDEDVDMEVDVSAPTNQNRSIVSRLLNLQRTFIIQDVTSQTGLSQQFIKATQPITQDAYKEIKEAQIGLADRGSLFFRQVKAWRSLVSGFSTIVTKICSELAYIVSTERALSETNRPVSLRMANDIGAGIARHAFEALEKGNGNADLAERLFEEGERVLFKPWGGGAAAYLATVALFRKHGGLEALLEMVKRVLSRTDEEAPPKSLKYTLSIVMNCVSDTVILHNRRLTEPISCIDMDYNDGKSVPVAEYFNPWQFLVETRIITQFVLQDIGWSQIARQNSDTVKRILELVCRLHDWAHEAEPHDMEGFDKTQLPWELKIPPLNSGSRRRSQGFKKDTIPREQRSGYPLANVVDGAPVVNQDRCVWRSQLCELQEDATSDLIDGVMEIVQEHPSTVFECAKMIGHSVLSDSLDVPVATALSMITSFDLDDEVDEKRSSTSSRLEAIAHLLGLLLQSPEVMELACPEVVGEFEILVSLLNRPNAALQPWYASIVFVIERIVTYCDIPIQEEPGEAGKAAMDKLYFQKEYEEARPRLDSKPLLEPLVRATKIGFEDHEEVPPISAVLATTRMLVHLSKDAEVAAYLLKNDVIDCLLKQTHYVATKGDQTSVEKLHTAMTLLLRQCMETVNVVRTVMRKEIRSWFDSHRVLSLTRDITDAHYQVICRNPDLFVDVAGELLCVPEGQNRSLGLKEDCENRLKKLEEDIEKMTKKMDSTAQDEEDENHTSVTDDREDDPGKQTEAGTAELPKPSESTETPLNLVAYGSGGNAAATAISLLMTHLTSLKVFDGVPQEPFRREDNSDYLHCCFVLQCIGELATYYDCKVALLDKGHRKRSPFMYILQEVLAVGTLSTTNNTATQQRNSIAGMATGVIENVLWESVDGGDMSVIRKTGVDLVGRALRDVLHSNEPTEKRYVLLGALSELCYRVISKNKGDDGLTLAWHMYERKFAGIITNNLGDMDVNFPGIRKVIKSALKFLNKMSLLAVSEGVTLTGHGEDEEDEGAQGSDLASELESNLDSDYDDRETPDLFRNSTLGMYEVEEDEDDEMEAEEDIGEGSDMMDYDEVNDDVQSDVENSEDDPYDVELIVNDAMDIDDESEEESDIDSQVEVIDEMVDADDSEWESYEEESGEDEDDTVTVLQELSGRRVPGPAGRVRIGSVRPLSRGMPSAMPAEIGGVGAVVNGGVGHRGMNGGDIDDQISYLPRDSLHLQDADAFSTDSDSEDEDSIDGETDGEIYDFNHAFARLRDFRMDRANGQVQAEAVANPMAQGLTDDSAERNRRRTTVSNIFNQFASLLGGSDQDLDLAVEGEFDLGMGRLGRSTQPPPEDALTVISHLQHSWTIMGRWQQMAMMFGVYTLSEVSQMIGNALLNRVCEWSLQYQRRVTELTEKSAALKQKLKEKLREQERKKLEAERKEQEEKEREKREAEERERQEEERANQLHEDAAMSNEPVAEAAGESQGDAANLTSTSSGSNLVDINGRQVDISGLGIDAAVLNELPPEFRQEAITQHVRGLRQEGGDVGELDPMFLEALPENVRRELVPDHGQEEAGRIDDMDVATFLATLDAPLRQTLLLEQPEDTLAQLPQELADEARQLRLRAGLLSDAIFGGDEGGLRSGRGDVELSRSHIRFRRGGDGDEGSSSDEDEGPRRGSRSAVAAGERATGTLQGRNAPRRDGKVHLLDRSGTASLLRLLYVPQTIRQRGLLHELLHSLCSHKANRVEMLNLLLHILQDGCGDRAQLERGFVQLCLKAAKKNTRSVTPRRAGGDNAAVASGGGLTDNAPGVPGSGSSSTSVNQVLFPDVSPLVVMQQTLECLDYLVGSSGSVKFFFLTEHEAVGGGSARRRSKPSSRETKFPINVLLGLLKQPQIIENNLALEFVTSILQEITRALAVVIKEHGREPPFVAEKNLTRLCRVLTYKECSSRTFQQTLAVMHNLCEISGVKDLFGGQLVDQAMSVVPLVTNELQDLVMQVRKARSGTDVQGKALAKFSSGESQQTKLLRVLTAIDYLFNVKEEEDADNGETEVNETGERGSNEEETGKKEREAAKEYLKSLYRKMSFGPLWGALSDCLALVQDHQDMTHVATALLPLIESLMVVCKNSKIKDVQLRETGTKYELRKNDMANEPLESLFFSFTDDHRKILNTLVRNNPKLMSGSFAILVKNPKALEFDNKRRYFYRHMYSDAANVHGGAVINVNVRRDQVFLDSYRSLYFKSPEEIKTARLNVRFQGEEAVDAGGVSREWYQVLSRQMFNPDYALFSPVASDSTTFHPNRTSWVNPEHLSFFKFVGRMMGKAIYDQRLLDCHFSRAVYKKILGKHVSIKDMETLDLDYYKSLLWMLENDITDIITETFSIEAEDYGEQKIIDLIPNGREIAVTEANKHEYVRLVVDYRLIKSVQEQMDYFLQDAVAIFDEQELELLISGMPDIDIDDWRNNTEYHNYTAGSSQIKWFWRAVRSFDAEERAKLLQFATGTSKVPLNGFAKLEGMNGVSKFSIHRDYGSKDRLPSSHTCFNQIDLPEYDSYETLRGALLTAITEGREGFGFA